MNRGIRDTLKGAPERFMAYNNGIVIVADELVLGQSMLGRVKSGEASPVAR